MKARSALIGIGPSTPKSWSAYTCGVLQNSKSRSSIEDCTLYPIALQNISLVVSMSAPIIGIDLGTSSCSVSCMIDGQPTVLPAFAGHDEMPTYVAFTADG